MKAIWNRRWVLPTLMLAAGVILGGCGKSSSGPTQTAPTSTQGAVDLTAVRKAFESADASFRFPLDEALRIVEAGGYGDALPPLQKLAANPKLTPEQKQSLQELVQKLQAMPARGGGR
jgi:hypothetical protein